MPVKGIIRRFVRALPETQARQEPSSFDADLRADDPEARLAMLDEFENAGLGWLWATDAAGKLSYISATACTEAMGLRGVPLTVLVETDADDPETSAARPLSFLLSTHARIADVIVRFAGAAGEDGRWWALSGQPRMLSDGAFAGYRGFARDVTREYRRKRDDSRAAEFDSLTGLFNRHRMTRRLDAILAAFRPVGRCCGVMMLDLDRFKHVNDTMGHPAGDELLRQVGERLRKVVGDRGEIGRLGGDEFQIVLPDQDLHDRGQACGDRRFCGGGGCAA